MNISFESYGRYSSSNYGVNTLVFSNTKGRFYFSYKTLVAFSTDDNLYVRENEWGNTTGKHLNWIDGGNKDAKSRRLTEEEFKSKYKELIEGDDD